MQTDMSVLTSGREFESEKENVQSPKQGLSLLLGVWMFMFGFLKFFQPSVDGLISRFNRVIYRTRRFSRAK